jgi:hypothetical protein
MADIAPLPRASIIRHQPQLMREEQSKADSIIAHAKRMQNWELLKEAIDEKIAQQQEFCIWWTANVTPGHGAGRGHKNNSERSSFSRAEAEKLTGILQQQVARWKKRLGFHLDNAAAQAAAANRYRERIFAAAKRAAELMAAANHRSEGTGDNEWFTPAEYVEAARLVLETIDLDPATHPKAQEWIRATQYFTRAEDGLMVDVMPDCDAHGIPQHALPDYQKANAKMPLALWFLAINEGVLHIASLDELGTPFPSVHSDWPMVNWPLSRMFRIATFDEQRLSRYFERLRPKHSGLPTAIERKELLQWLRPRQLELDGFIEHFLIWREQCWKR